MRACVRAFVRVCVITKNNGSSSLSQLCINAVFLINRYVSILIL